MNRQEWACPACGVRYPDEGEITYLCHYGHPAEAMRRVDVLEPLGYNDAANRLRDKRVHGGTPPCGTCGEDPFFCEHELDETA